MPKMIISADFHLRRDVPRCRLQTQEEWLETQRQQVRFVVKQAKKRLCPLYITGDIFDSPVVHPIISNMLADELGTQKTYIIAGNHDAPYHNIELLQQASIWPFINVPEGGAHFGTEKEIVDLSGKEIIFIHTLVFPEEVPYGAAGISAKDLMKNYPDARWIFTGDNHTGFHCSSTKQNVLNPGSLNRQTADQINYGPACYFVDTDKTGIGALEKILIPDPVELVTDAYLKAEEAREDRIGAFIEKIESKAETTLDFRANLKEKMKEPAAKNILPTIEKICEKAGVYLALLFAIISTFQASTAHSDDFISAFMLVQNANLVYVDIFQNTLPNLQGGDIERNPIAAPLFKIPHGYEIGYALAMAGNASLAGICQAIDHSGMLSQIAMGIVGTAEVLAVGTSFNAAHVDIKMNATLFIYRF